MLISSSDLFFIICLFLNGKDTRTAVIIVKNNMLIWNSNCELDWASISNFKAPGLKIQIGNCSKLSFISDGSPVF